mmetsp:Transcript_54847/g.64130  ORF Transcript_54847/g.64130 Transcript_54847/m.64130 type:complete len:211 (-) Transcript_54847:773-1405(-)
MGSLQVWNRGGRIRSHLSHLLKISPATRVLPTSSDFVSGPFISKYFAPTNKSTMRRQYLKPVCGIFVSSSLSDGEIALLFGSSFTTSGTGVKLLDAVFVFTTGASALTFSSDWGTGLPFAFTGEPLLSSAEREPVDGFSIASTLGSLRMGLANFVHLFASVPLGNAIRISLPSGQYVFSIFAPSNFFPLESQIPTYSRSLKTCSVALLLI